MEVLNKYLLDKLMNLRVHEHILTTTGLSRTKRRHFPLATGKFRTALKI